MFQRSEKGVIVENWKVFFFSASGSFKKCIFEKPPVALCGEAQTCRLKSSARKDERFETSQPV